MYCEQNLIRTVLVLACYCPLRETSGDLRTHSLTLGISSLWEHIEDDTYIVTTLHLSSSFGFLDPSFIILKRVCIFVYYMYIRKK